MAHRPFRFSHCLVAVTLATGGIINVPIVDIAVAQSQDQQLSQTVAALLASNPNGGDRLAQAVHDLVLANPAALNVIVAAVKANGNDAQQSAAGQGLGMAAQDAVKANNQQLAVAIQAAVAGSGMPLAVASFTTAAGDATIAAISNAGGQQAGGGGGGSGSPTGNGPPTGGGGGTGGGTGSNGTGTQQANLTGGGSLGGGSNGSQNSVSPR